MLFRNQRGLLSCTGMDTEAEQVNLVFKYVLILKNWGKISIFFFPLFFQAEAADRDFLGNTCAFFFNSGPTNADLVQG